eukprot:TRINITY_DN43130_c0_g1_i1.p1 TRINITY_DN43130_c0_g1~~TRINITY_DN43130_c0_g1_i1.p1  ORF type:complete len:572 (+),score=149.47 TRINITY_DN43130_c0_g1_i1:62-1717(+)
MASKAQSAAAPPVPTASKAGGQTPPRKVQRGIVWPQTSSGTTDAAKGMLAASASGVDDSVASSVASERKWRANYAEHIVKHVEMCCKSPEAALKASQQGLDYLYDNFRFTRDGAAVRIDEAMAAPQRPCPFRTAEVCGTAPKPSDPCVAVPWSLTMTPGKPLTGAALERQLDAARAQGLMEESVPQAIKRLHSDGSWRARLTDTVFVVIGAGSAMGPLRTLLSLGATVVAVDLPVPQVWSSLIKAARESPGKLLFPVASGFSGTDLTAAAGCNVIEQTPEVGDWLRTVAPDMRMVVGQYAYADGAAFVRLTLAMDAVSQAVVRARPQGTVSLAYLCSPTDAFGGSETARRESQRRHSVAGLGAEALWQVPARIAASGKYLVPNTAGSGKQINGMRVVDCLVSQQGPNYVLAKRLQHWRAILSRNEGVAVSTNIAPASHTVSVRKVRLLAAAYDGCRRFGIEIFNPLTSSTLMTALLLHDVGFTDVPSHPSCQLAQPMQLFSYGAVHGGMWVCPYLVRSAVEVAAVLQLALEFKVPHAVAALAAAATIRARL